MIDKLNIPAGYIYQYQADETLITTVLELAKRQEFINNEKNQVSVHDSFFHAELFDWFEECIKDTVYNKLHMPPQIDVPIVSCWVNKSTKLQFHHDHTHPNSFLSAILYLTSHEDSETIFYYKNIWYDRVEWSNLKSVIKPLYDEIKILPKAGTLILFPSSLNHKVKPVKGNNVRYSLSFNTFISGCLAEGESKSRLNLYVESLRQRIQNL